MNHLLEVKNITAGLLSGKMLFSNISFDINEGELLYVTGPSGSGKTTLLKILNGLLLPDSGNLFYRKINFFDIDKKILRKKIQLLPQRAVMFEGTVLENLMYADFATEEKCRIYLEEMNLSPEILSQRALTLSEGQSSRIAAIRSMLMEPDILLLDEPTAALDKENRDNFRNRIISFLDKTKTACIWISHEDSADSSNNRKLRIGNAD